MLLSISKERANYQIFCAGFLVDDFIIIIVIPTHFTAATFIFYKQIQFHHQPL